jgi:glycosyltransferase involved in cell wall biosynthesis
LQKAGMSAQVAIITPTFNRVALLAETLDSVAAQTFDDWEHIVVDDGSDDGTAEMMRSRMAADPRLRYIVRDSDPRGANACRNIGARATQAPLIVFLDSDDLLAPDCLSRRVGVMQHNHDFDFATFQSGIFIERPGDHQNGRVFDAQLIGDDLARFLRFEAPWQTTAPIWRRETLMWLGLFDESLLSWQDIELHVRALCAGCRYVRFPEVDNHIRWQNEETKISVQQRRSPRHLDGAINVIERLEGHVRRGPGMNFAWDRGLCSLYFFVAELWVDRGDLRRALDTWRHIVGRGLGTASLHREGAVMLALKRSRAPLAGQIVHKWKGWARFRTQPDLIST